MGGTETDRETDSDSWRQPERGSLRDWTKRGLSKLYGSLVTVFAVPHLGPRQ